MRLITKTPPTTMKRINLFGLVTLLVFMACSGGEEVQTTTEELVKTVNITTQPIIPSTFASYVRVIGNVETSNDIMISAELSGKIVSFNVEEGQNVKKGQTILRIDDSKLKQEKARIEAITLQAKENYERLKKVYEEDGIGSELDYLNAKYAYDQSNSALESINVDLANTRVKAPFNGRVESKLMDIGEMVSAGTHVVRLIGSDDYKITAGVPARYADVIVAGDKVDIWFDTQGSQEQIKEISFVGNSIDPQDRTFRIEIDLADNENMKVDMITNIRLKTLEKTDVIVVSEEFIYSKDGQYVSYVLAENEKGKPVALEKVVELGPSYKSNVVVESGLEVGEELITIGSAFLNNGMRVNIVESKSIIATK